MSCPKQDAEMQMWTSKLKLSALLWQYGSVRLLLEVTIGKPVGMPGSRMQDAL